jgi:hypothetical protein
MSLTQDAPGTPNPAAPAQPAAPPAPQTATPNQYHLHGGGISITYYPEGFSPGPIVSGKGPLRLIYQDAQRSLSFHDDEVRTVDVPDLGTLISVTLVRTVDIGDTTFSLLLPHVVLPAQTGASAFIRTEGITTVHRAFVALIGHAQAEVYSVTRLRGTAVRAILPM